MPYKILQAALFLLLTVSAYAGAGGHKRKVLIIGIDGCRSDALQVANTPNIDSLVAHGFYTYDSWHQDITISGPSWSSILCGVYHEKHGVTNNTYAGSNYNQYPYITTYAKSIDTSFKFVQYTEWAPMSNDVYNDNWDSKIIGTDGFTQATGAAAAGLIQDPGTDLLFAYFDKVDITGHASGFSPTNPAYIQAIDSIDVQVGNIIYAMKQRPTYAQEDWLVLMITDHGGIGTGHGGVTYEERHIWWIAYSDRCRPLRVSGPQDSVQNNPPDPGLYTYYPVLLVDTAKQHESPVQPDIAVTALHHLIYDSGIDPQHQPSWAFDGRSWLCEMGLCNDKTTGLSTIREEMSLAVSPNPSKDGRFTLWCDNFDTLLEIKVSDMNGHCVYRQSLNAFGLKHQLDLSGLAAGTYLLTCTSGAKSSSKTIVKE